MKDCKERNNLIFKMPCSQVKMQFKRPPQKLNFVMTKAISKSCILDFSCKCFCTFLFSIKPFYNLKTKSKCKTRVLQITFK